jgi:hypothetical protein
MRGKNFMLCFVHFCIRNVHGLESQLWALRGIMKSNCGMTAAFAGVGVLDSGCSPDTGALAMRLLSARWGESEHFVSCQPEWRMQQGRMRPLAAAAARLLY